MRILFVSATGTGVGKTFATLKLLETFAARGIRVGACKPVETGVVANPEDATRLLHRVQRLNPSFSRFRPHDLCAYTFPLPAAPFCADVTGTLREERILAKIFELREHCELLIVEGAGGLMVPLQTQWFMIDLARELEAFTLLITPSRLGCINETLLSLEALRSRQISHDWCVNLHEDADAFPQVTQPFYDAAFPHWWSLQKGLEAFAERFISSSGHPSPQTP
jgi:dethiobiotin synthetase